MQQRDAMLKTFVAGGILGAVLTALLTPQNGRMTREKLKDGMETMKDKVHDKTEKMKSVIHKEQRMAKEAAEDIAKRVDPRPAQDPA